MVFSKMLLFVTEIDVKVNKARTTKNKERRSNKISEVGHTP
jgi:hypothetical protein